MTFKYALMLGDRLPDFGDIYNLCHIPIDNIVLQTLSRYGPPPLDVNWSRIDNYTRDYLPFQQWIRGMFRVAPLDLEFREWMGKDVSANVRSA